MSQHMEALELGNGYRLAQCELRRQVAFSGGRAEGCVMVAELLERMDLSPDVAGLRLAKLLDAIPRVGPTAVLKLEDAAGVHGMVRLGELSYGQRRGLAAGLRLMASGVRVAA